MITASEPFLVDFSPFVILDRDERKRQLEDYLRYLRNHDGTADVKAKTLSRREEFFKELGKHPVRWQGPIERDQFQRYIDQKPPEGIDPKILWLLAAAKSNIAENYGVALDLRLKGSHYGSDSHAQHMTFIDLEEFYHTRILKDAVRIFGIEYELGIPETFTRWFTQLIIRAPFHLRIVTALCGELFGSVIFQLLWERADIFSAEPVVMERLRLLMREILVDEMGHVAFGHANVGEASHALMRLMLPAVANHFLDDFPELVMLGGGRKKVLARVFAFDLARNQQLWPRLAAAA